MNALRFLLVHSDAQHADRISSLLTGVNHTVLAAPNLAEGVEALLVERFDAALVDAAFPISELAEFTAMLRKMEESNGVKRIPVVSVSAENAPDLPSGSENPAWDTCLREPLDPVGLTEAVTRLAQAIGHPKKQQTPGAPNAHPVLEPEEFEEQMGGDHELMVEIIDLFFEEGKRQVAEMGVSLANGNFAQLSRLAHTIKGSLGSLRATRARWRAQDLESAAAEQDGPSCRESFSALERDLRELEPELVLLRQRVLA